MKPVYVKGDSPSKETLPKLLHKYSLGSDAKLDIVSSSSGDLLKKVNAIIKRQDKGVVISWKDEGVYIAKNGMPNNSFYKKINKWGEDIPLSSSLLFQYYTIRTGKEDTTTEVKSFGSDDYFSMLEDPKYPKNIDKQLRAVTNNSYPEETTIGDIRVYLRLFPVKMQLVYPRMSIKTSVLSNNEILQTTSAKNNIRINLSRNIAFNTIDTQWLELYQMFIDYWQKKGNPSFQLMVGDYVVDNCYFIFGRNDMLFSQRNKAVELFNCSIISEDNDFLDIHTTQE